MRDGFLIFLMCLAGMITAGYIVLLVTVTRRDADNDGCLLWIAGLVAAGIVSAILATVGHAVGVNVTDLTGG